MPAAAAGGTRCRYFRALKFFLFRKVLFAEHIETEQPASNKRPPFQEEACLPTRAISGEVSSVISLAPLVLPPAVTLTLSLSVSWSLEQTVAGDAVFSHMRRSKS